MRSDTIKKYIVLRESLYREKKALEQRLVQINEALAEVPAFRSTPSNGGKGGDGVIDRVSAPRIRNALSLKKAVVKVTSGHPLSKAEILEAVKKMGYRFAAKAPMNSLNTVLYSRNQFKNENGKFSPAKTA